MKDVVVVGAGLSGCTIARLMAEKRYKVTVYEKHDYVGGAASDYKDKETGIIIPRFGLHILHTNDAGVYKFLNRFGDFNNYKHYAGVEVFDKIIPFPITKDGAKFFKNKKHIRELIFEPYTQKQWGKKLDELPKSLLKRVAVKKDNNPYYFQEKYQGFPIKGWTKLCENMLKHKNIKLKQGEDITLSFNNPNTIKFYTGRMERGFGFLDYHTCSFYTMKSFNGREYLQEYPQENIPDLDKECTRVYEPKRWSGGKKNCSLLIFEYPKKFEWLEGSEPLYPLIDKENQKKAQMMRKVVRGLEKKGIYYAGRLGTYRYINIDQAVREAMDLVKKVTEGCGVCGKGK